MQKIPLLLGAVWVASLGAIGRPAQAQQGDGTRMPPYTTHIFKPAKVAATPERIAQLKAPAGFTVSAFATGLKNTRVIAVGPDGSVYVSRRDQGDVLLLKDADGDGKADGPPVIVANRPGAHGIAIRGGKFYLVTVRQLFVADILPDGRLGPLTMLAGDLPDAGQHANRTLAFGPDGMLYMSVGSTCNDCNEDNPENATILRMTPEGKSRTIFASGLRNTIGFDWNPKTGELWGLDHGIDFLGDEAQPEELNHIAFGKQYGWPHVYGAGEIYPQSTPPGGITKAQWKLQSEPMVLGYTAHSAPMQMLFYRGTAFPAEYRGDAFATMRGSWNRDPASGYEIVRVSFDPEGQPVRFEPFVSGFLTDGGTTHIARPVGLAMARDGALLMADDANGVIYRIAYAGNAPTGSTSSNAALTIASVPAGPMLAQTSAGTGVPLATDRPETRAAGALTINSPAFMPNAALALKYSSYADDVSPAIAWTAVAGAKSYALILEDPDAKPVTPFVHWVVYNLPPSVTRLPEGLQKQLRLTEPENALEGKTSRGSVGYYGPHPPVGDPPHHYVFQLFALDTMLNADPGATRDQVLAAMDGHVLAKGRLIGTYQQVQAPLK